MRKEKKSFQGIKDTIKENDSYIISLNPKTIESYYINKCIEWTLKAYENKTTTISIELFNKYRVLIKKELEQIAKDKEIPKYRTIPKAELINILSTITTNNNNTNDIKKHTDAIISIFNY